MRATNNLVELCNLLVEDAYGELASRVFTTLLRRDRCTISNLVQFTASTSDYPALTPDQPALTKVQIRTALLALLKCNLLFYHCDESNDTWYTANVSAAYNLIRRPKYLISIETLYGPAAKEVAETLQALGSATVGELEDIFRKKMQESQKSEVTSVNHFKSVLVTLIRGDVLESVSARSFQSQADRILEVEKEIGEKHFRFGVKGTKEREKWQQLRSSRLRELRDLPKELKRSMETHAHNRSKLQKLTNGDIEKAARDDDGYRFLTPDTTLRINDEKCTVILRNEELVRVVSETIGETTGQVYNVVLRLLTESVPRCRPDPMIDGHGGDVESVTTMAIFEHLDPFIDVFAGIGMTPDDKIDFRLREKLQKRPPSKRLRYDEAEADENASGDEDSEDMDEDEDWDEDEDYDSEYEHIKSNLASAADADKESRVTFDDSVLSRQSRLLQMREHLLLLSESPKGFLRHCARGKWTVDFPTLIANIREMQFDDTIVGKFGRRSIRLINTLRRNGKLQDKHLSKLTLMTRGEVNDRMYKLLGEGYAEIQEVPKDNTRTANRTIHLWDINMKTSIGKLIEDTHKTLARNLQVLAVRRRENENLLTLVDNPLVEGAEKEMLDKKYYHQWLRYCRDERQHLALAARLDSDLVVLRDS